jgi:formylglycine-generating enzyme required for sulfatase activity
MSKIIHGKNFRKLTAFCVIIAFVCQVSLFSVPSEDEVIKQLSRAKASYLKKNYGTAKKRVEKIIAVINEKKINRPDILGQCYLLLGAIYESEAEPLRLAEENYRKAKEKYGMLLVEGVDLESLALYRRVVKGEGEKRIIEGPPKEKKKKFPWLLAAAGAAAAVVVAILLLKKKKSVEYDVEILGVEWLDVPAGEFQMGNNFGGGFRDERPVHTVYLEAYKISKYEVTFEQYDKFCEETGHRKPNDFGWGRGKRPVVDVSWDDARAFCDWLSQETGKNIHLPTEARWEKAARGTDQRKYPWGNTTPSCDFANYKGCIGRTMPVGSCPAGASPYGAHDMAGNVWEWCADWYDSAYYTISPTNNPTGPAAGSKRVLRGGAWNTEADYISTFNREDSAPYHAGSRTGFRLCRD